MEIQHSINAKALQYPTFHDVRLPSEQDPIDRLSRWTVLAWLHIGVPDVLECGRCTSPDWEVVGVLGSVWISMTSSPTYQRACPTRPVHGQQSLSQLDHNELYQSRPNIDISIHPFQQ